MSPSASESADLLADPVVREHTRRILALQQEERRTREKLGRLIAAIGAELMAVKEALDQLSDKTAWLRWLRQHVRYSAKTAERYMQVARWSGKFDNVVEFFGLDPSVIYRIAALPDAIAATLTPDTPLTDPRTGRQKPLKDMSARELDRALDALEGRTPPERPERPSGEVALIGDTREAFAADALRVMGQLSDELAKIRGRKGRLTGEAKQRALEAIERQRRIVLKWPAWAQPAEAAQTRKRTSAAAARAKTGSG